MSMKITNAAASYSNDFPIFGHIVDQSNLRLALRATGYSNLVDLSPFDNAFTVSPGVIFTEQGPKTIPNGNDIKSNYPEQDDSFTILTAFKVDKAGRAALAGEFQYRAYIGGSYAGSTAAGGGIGLLVYASASATVPGTFDLSVRLISRSKYISTGAYGSIAVVAKFVANAVTLPDSTGWIYAAATFDHVTGKGVVKLLNKDLEARFTYAPATFALDAVSRGILDGAGAPLLHHVGGIVGAYTGVEQNDVYVPHYMLYAGVMSDAAIGLQCEADKKWLLAARGIAL